MKFLEVHLLHTLPPSSPNRDEGGRPKSTVYGGVERLRVSSQAQKRQARLLFRELDLIPEGERAVRTRRLAELLSARMGLPLEEVLPPLKGLLKALGLGEKGGRAEYLLFLGEGEVETLAGILRDHWEVLEAYGAPEEEEKGEEEAPKRARKKAKAKAGELPAELLERFKAFPGRPSLEVALFGRMLADRGDAEVEGALYVAHALSVLRDPIEEDYFTAVDDVPAEDGSLEAGMIEVQGFGSGLLYRYALLDLGGLERSVGKERALLGLEAVLRAFPLALPRGKARAFAHLGEPEAILLRLGKGFPRNLARAYLRPVEGKDPLRLALERLLRYWEEFDRVYGPPEGEWRAGVTVLEAPLPPFPWRENLEALIGEAKGRAAEL